MKNIVVLDGFVLNPGDISWDPLKSLGELTIHERSSKEDIIARCEQADIVITNKVPFDAQTIETLDRLKCIAVTATGYNIINIEAAEKHNKAVCNVPAYSTNSVAQHAFGMLLELYSGIASHAHSVASGTWQSCSDFSYRLTPITELAGKTAGILGLGNIGQAVAKIAMAFGMKVIAHTRTARGLANIVEVEQNQLFSESDVLFLTAPETNDTRGIINQKTLDLMKTRAVLINTARGGLVVEQDLADALKGGKIAAAGLDVLRNEPPEKNNPLIGIKNCLITPHIAWASMEARRRCMEITVKNVEAFLEGERLNRVV
jgi:glycerate dehydrogenase